MCEGLHPASYTFTAPPPRRLPARAALLPRQQALFESKMNETNEVSCESDMSERDPGVRGMRHLLQAGVDALVNCVLLHRRWLPQEVHPFCIAQHLCSLQPPSSRHPLHFQDTDDLCRELFLVFVTDCRIRTLCYIWRCLVTTTPTTNLCRQLPLSSLK